MTKQFTSCIITGLLMLCTVAACSDDTDITYVDEGDYTNCGVSSFSLGKDDKVLNSLDSVYFSIDLVTAQIYNADSLPKGTDVSHMIVKVGTPAASAVDLAFKSRYTGNDTIVHLIDNPNDSINFAAGPVKMTVKSYNGVNERDYTIKLNVHTIDADTLCWNSTGRITLPKTPVEQKTVMYGGKPHTLLKSSDGAYYICITDDPAEDNWMSTQTNVPSGILIESFNATDDALYISDSQGALYTSTDDVTWTTTGATMHCIYGGYGSTLLGARNDSDGWKHVTYPATAEIAVAADCPVSGTSEMFTYSTKWSDSAIALMIGGKDASGRYTGECWAYDGTKWSRISATGIDEREGVTLFAYDTPRLSSNSWRVTRQSALLAMGGRYETEDGITCDNKVYISYDLGITWKEADSYLQFPEEYPDFCFAQACVMDYTLTVNSSRNMSLSRVSKPVTSWECPYIFLFGGINADGTLLPYVTRGVINRFTFQPLY